MFPGFAVLAHSQTATKRIVIYWVGVSVSILAAVLFGFHGGLQAPKSILAERGISAVATQIQPRLAASYGKLPLSFEVNQGQTDPRVKFLSRGRGYTLFLTGDEAVLALKKPEVRSQKSEIRNRETSSILSRQPLTLGALRSLPQMETSSQLQRTTGNGPRTRHLSSPFLIQNPKSKIQNLPAPGAQPSAREVVRLRLVGANPNAAVRGDDELPGKANYFIGNDPKKWRANVPTYAKVRYQNVYPGVDLVYYGNQSGQLEYDFVVAPGADPSAVTLDVGAHGHAPLRIDDAGDLVVHLNSGDLHFRKPVIYQPTSGHVQRTTDDGRRTDADPRSKIENPESVEGHFLLDAQNRIHFALGPYDHSQPLVVDPVLSYSTYLGGSGSDWGSGIAADSAGNVYVIGGTASTNFPTASPLQGSYGGGNLDVFVAKLNAGGSALIYSTYLGGSSDDYPGRVAIDSSGNVYVTGYTSSTDFPTVNPLQANYGGGEWDAFVTKLNAAGSALVYSTYLGGDNADFGWGIAVDAASNAYVSVQTRSTNFPTINPLQASYGGGLADVAVAKLNAAGSALVYSTYLGGSSADFAGDIAVDSTGNAYVTGCTNSTNFPTMNPLQTSYAGGYWDAFVAKLNTTGSALVYSTYLGGSKDDCGSGIAVDSAGNAYLTGGTCSTDFPTVNAVQTVYGGGTCAPEGEGDAFVAKLNPAGSALVYSTYLGGSELEEGHGIAVDSSGNAYVTGDTSSTDFPTVNAMQTTNKAGSNGTAFVTMLNAAGSTLLYSTYLGGSNQDGAYGISVDSLRNTYVSGYTSSADFPTANPLQASYGGGSGDAFAAKIGAANSPGIAFGPGALTFAAQIVGTSSASRSVTLTAAGSQPLNVTSITPSGDFALATTDTSCPYTGGAVASGATCTIDVSFTPMATGTRTAAVSVVDNAANSPQSIALTGTGIAPEVNLSPSSLTFPGQFVGTTGLPQNVTLTNNGDVPLNISSIQASAQFGTSNGCTTSLAAGVGCTISVFFDPSAAGPQTGTLTITDSAPDSPQRVQLSGTGMDFQMSSSTASQTVSAGQTATYSLALAPQGGLNQTVSLTCSGAPSLSTCALTPNPVTLNGTTPAAVTVSVSTMAGSLAPPFGKVPPPRFTGLGRMFWLYAFLALASLGALAGAGKRRAAYLLGACLLIVVLWSACGGGTQVIHTPGTPTGTYTVDVSATVTSSAPFSTLTHDFKFSLTVD